MARRLPVREPLSVILRRNLAREEANNACLPDDDPRKAANAARLARFRAELPPLPQKRGPRKATLDLDAIHKKARRPLERDVLKAVLDVLRRDPRVAHVERTQSALLREGERFIRVGFKGKLDITGMTTTGRYFELEVKRPGAKPDSRQAERIATIRANGGISGYCWSVESALALLP